MKGEADLRKAPECPGGSGERRRPKRKPLKRGLPETHLVASVHSLCCSLPVGSRALPSSAAGTVLRVASWTTKTGCEALGRALALRFLPRFKRQLDYESRLGRTFRFASLVCHHKLAAFLGISEEALVERCPGRSF